MSGSTVATMTFKGVNHIGVNGPSFGRTVLLLDALSFCTSFGL